MATIGGITVDILRGLEQPMKTRLEVWQTDGIDGYGALKLGLGDSGFDLATVSYQTSIANAKTHKAALVGLQGQMITIVDDWTTTFTRILVEHVEVQFVPCVFQGNALAVRVAGTLKVCQT